MLKRSVAWRWSTNPALACAVHIRCCKNGALVCEHRMRCCQVGEEIYETAEKANLSGAAATVSTQRSSLLAGLDPKAKLAIEVGQICGSLPAV